MTAGPDRSPAARPGVGPAGFEERRERAAVEVLTATRSFLAGHGLHGVEPRVLSRRANVVLALDGLDAAAGTAPLVVRSPTRTDLLAGQRPDDPWRHRLELGLARRLVAGGAPVVPPAGPDDALPAGPHVVDGHVLTVWRAADDPGEDGVPAAALGRALRALHDVAAGLRDAPEAAGLVPLGPVTADVDLVLATGAASGEVAPDLLPRLRAVADAVVGPLLAGRSGVRGAAGDTWQPVLGDAHPGNVLLLDGRPVWNDLEDACLAPPGWDLGVLLSSARTDGAAAVAAYGVTDPGALRPWVAARDVQRAVWTALRARTPDEVAAVHALVDDLLAR